MTCLSWRLFHEWYTVMNTVSMLVSEWLAGVKRAFMVVDKCGSLTWRQFSWLYMGVANLHEDSFHAQVYEYDSLAWRQQLYMTNMFSCLFIKVLCVKAVFMLAYIWMWLYLFLRWSQILCFCVNTIPDCAFLFMVQELQNCSSQVVESCLKNV